ncbi:MAG TPA: TPM domain-containing protein [Acidimicrobiales bacterium]|nr:TPM domain-containing protein [Acidimicrobiales bacterium]
MARGEITSDEQVRIATAVAAAERDTGLEMCVAVCKPGAESTRTQAERAFRRLELPSRPAVLVIVLPRARKVEVVTSAVARTRLSDDDCAAAVAVMVDRFAENDIAGGVEAGLVALATRAGARGEASDQTELPDVIEA